MDASEVLLKAVDVIHERGWCRGHFQDDEGRVCLIRAIALTAPGVENFNLRRAAHARLWRELNTMRGGLAPTDWNDEVARDADEVIDLLKRASEPAVADPC